MSDSKPINPELQQLRELYNPEEMNVIEQSRIIHDALQPTGDFPRSTKRLAEYLNLSVNKVYKLNFVHEKMLPEVKEWIKTTSYQMSTAYAIASLKPEEQIQKLREYQVALGQSITTVGIITP
jgi:hypothetical protein